MTPREKWSDDRLDDLNAKVDKGFEDVRADIRALNARFDALNRNLLVVAGAIIAALVGLHAF